MSNHARQVQSIEVSAVVTRCTCGQPETHRGKPCPLGHVEDRGTVGYWSRSPWQRLRYRLKKGWQTWTT